MEAQMPPSIDHEACEEARRELHAIANMLHYAREQALTLKADLPAQLIELAIIALMGEVDPRSGAASAWMN